MKYGFKNNIRVLYEASMDKYAWTKVPAPAQKPEEKKWYEKLGDAALWFTNVLANIDDEMKEVLFEVKDALSSNNDKVKATLSILNATGTLKTNSISEFASDIPSLLVRWKWDAGKSWMRQILIALKNAKNKGEVSIITYSDNHYKTQTIDQYNTLIYNDSSRINKWVINWLSSLRWTKVPGLSEETWSKIGLYILNRPDTTITTDLTIQNTNQLRELGKSEKLQKETKLQKELESIFVKPGIKEFLEKKGIVVNGKTDILWELNALKERKASIQQIEEYCNKLGENLKKESKSLLQESKEQAKKANIDKKTFKDIWIEWLSAQWKDGKRVDISDLLIASLDEQYAKDTLLQINDWLSKRDKKSSTYEQDQKNVEAIRSVLWLKVEAFKRAQEAAKAKGIWKDAEQHRLKWGTTENFEPPSEEKLERIWEIAKARFQQESTGSDLSAFWIHNLEEAQKQLHTLWHKETREDLTEKEEYLKKLLEQYVKDNTHVALEYSIAVNVFGEKQAQHIFSDTNRFISNKPNEQYNFDALEKIATLTDPESTPSQKTLAKLEPGQAVSMSELFRQDEDRSPVYAIAEFEKMIVSKNPDGTYNIPMFEAKNIDEKQVQEYKNQSATYAELGLSQFIPHIPRITRELQKQGIYAEVDGNENNKKQEQVLKYLYKKLFGRENEILPASVPEMMQKFWSIRWNPANMRNSMQSVLEKNGLIPAPDQPIREDTMIDWFRQNAENNHPDAILNNLP